jgi:hypothetical protein
MSAFTTMYGTKGRHRPPQLFARAVLFAFIQGAGAHCLAASPEEAPFLHQNESAMTKMMAAMDIKPSGDVDRDFVDMMVPHHQGAIDMAQAVMRYGRNEQIRRLAQEIIVTQQQEIAAMRLAVGQPLPASAPSPTAVESLSIHAKNSNLEN